MCYAVIPSSYAVGHLWKEAHAAKTSVRFAPEIYRKLEVEAQKLARFGCETVTVSQLIRAYIMEKLAVVSVKAGREKAAIDELRDEVRELKERHALLAMDVEKLGRLQRSSEDSSAVGGGRNPRLLASNNCGAGLADISWNARGIGVALLGGFYHRPSPDGA